MTQFFYTLFLNCYYSALRIVSLWNPKARLWLDGRKVSFLKVKNANLSNCIWFHAASLGEFEQISYLIEQIRHKYSSEKIVVSFFSPSGYEPKKNFKFADEIVYLPFDFQSKINEWIDLVNPKIVFWVRYEFWLNTLSILESKRIPVYLLNGVFYPKTNPLYLPILRKSLSKFTKIFVISEDSKVNLAAIGLPSEVLFDTRYDRMNQIKQAEFIDTKIEKFKATNKLVVCGSIWNADDIILAPAIQSMEKIHWVLVPHEINALRINELKSRFPNSQAYSDFNPDIKCSILIVDTMGFLSRIYRYADVCYVGGGFTKVVHSLIEPLAYHKPIIIGKKIEKSEEAREFVQDKQVCQIFNSAEFHTKLTQILSKNNDAENQRKKDLFTSRLGSVDKLMKILKDSL